MTQPIHKVSDVVREFEEWMATELSETGGEIGQSDLADKMEDALTTLLSSIVERIEGEIETRTNLDNDTENHLNHGKNIGLNRAITIIKSSME